MCGSPSAPHPTTIQQVMARHKDIQFASRGKSHVARQAQIHRLRHVVRELAKRLPPELRADPVVQDMAEYGCGTLMHLVRLLSPRLDGEDHTKDIDFTRAGIESRWKAGYDHARKVLAEKPWERRPTCWPASSSTTRTTRRLFCSTCPELSFTRSWPASKPSTRTACSTRPSTASGRAATRRRRWRDLADAGIGGASLYNTFGDKRALFTRSLERYANRSMRERIARLEASNRPKRRSRPSSRRSSTARWATRTAGAACS